MTQPEMVAAIERSWHARFAGQWDDWLPAVVQRRIYHFGVCWFDKSERTLVAPVGTDDGRREAYSWKQLLNVPVRPEDVRLV